MRLQPLTRARVARLGEPGRAWAEALPRRVAELCAQWSLEPGRPLPGGSASYVLGVRTRAGEPRVLKVLAPDPTLADEAPVLAAADGAGYVRLHAHEPDALLLERLGPALDAGRPEPADVLGTVVDTLQRAWRTDPAGLGRAPLDKAAELLRDLEENLAACTPLVHAHARVLDAARGLGRELSASYDPARAVLAHGDPHPGNLLRRGDTAWAFVDPDGLLVEPEYDLGVVLRDHGRRLLESADPRALHDGWVALVAERAGADAERVAAWSLLERVSTGVFVCALGSPAVGLPFLDSAERLLAGAP